MDYTTRITIVGMVFNPIFYNWNRLSIIYCLTLFVLVRCQTKSPEDFSAIEVFYIIINRIISYDYM